MDWMDGLNTFYFDNHEALDHEAKPRFRNS
jgi:hypothetical protein